MKGQTGHRWTRSYGWRGEGSVVQIYGVTVAAEPPPFDGNPVEDCDGGIRKARPAHRVGYTST
jgi:hypothetical protein